MSDNDKKIGNAKTAERFLQRFINSSDGRLSGLGICAEEGLTVNQCHNISWAIQDAYECGQNGSRSKDQCFDFEPRPFDEATYRKLTVAGLSNEFAREFVDKGGIRALKDRISWIRANMLKRSVFDRKFSDYERIQMVEELGKYGKASLVALPELIEAIKGNDPYMQTESLETLLAILPRSKELVKALLPLLGSANSKISSLSRDIISKVGYVDDSLVDELVTAMQRYADLAGVVEAIKKALMPYGRKSVERLFSEFHSHKVKFSALGFFSMLYGFGDGLVPYLPELYDMMKEAGPKEMGLKVKIMKVMASAGSEAWKYAAEFLSVAENNRGDRETYLGALSSLVIMGDTSRPTMAMLSELFNSRTAAEGEREMVIGLMRPIKEYAGMILAIMDGSQGLLMVHFANDKFSQIELSFQDVCEMISGSPKLNAEQKSMLELKLSQIYKKDKGAEGFLKSFEERLSVSERDDEKEILMSFIYTGLGADDKEKAAFFVPLLIRYISESGNSDTRRAAIFALGKLGRYSWLAIPMLESISGDKKDNEWYVAGVALKNILDEIR